MLGRAPALGKGLGFSGAGTPRSRTATPRSRQGSEAEEAPYSERPLAFVPRQEQEAPEAPAAALQEAPECPVELPFPLPPRGAAQEAPGAPVEPEEEDSPLAVPGGSGLEIEPFPLPNWQKRQIPARLRWNEYNPYMELQPALPGKPSASAVARGSAYAAEEYQPRQHDAEENIL